MDHPVLLVSEAKRYFVCGRVGRRLIGLPRDDDLVGGAERPVVAELDVGKKCDLLGEHRVRNQYAHSQRKEAKDTRRACRGGGHHGGISFTFALSWGTWAGPRAELHCAARPSAV